MLTEQTLNSTSNDIKWNKTKEETIESSYSDCPIENGADHAKVLEDLFDISKYA